MKFEDTRPRKPAQYTVRVDVVARGNDSAVRVDLQDASGVTYTIDLADVLFSTAAQAEAAGWRLAEEWLRRTRERVADADRLFLVMCDHSVARCPACMLSHRFFELVDDRFCARCGGDLVIPLHLHLRSCRDVNVRRAQAVVRKAQLTGKETARIRDAADVARVESDALRQAARKRRPEGGRVCPVCATPIQPGDGVSFQRGALLHLRCYESGRPVSGSDAETRPDR